MKSPKNYVCNLKLAKELKKLGIKQKSLFYWFKTADTKEWKIAYLEDCLHWDKSDLFSAFTCAELGEILPDQVISLTDKEGYWNINQGIIYMNQKRQYFIELEGDDSEKIHKRYGKKAGSFIESREVNARAKMIIYLIENQLTDELVKVK